MHMEKLKLEQYLKICGFQVCLIKKIFKLIKYMMPKIEESFMLLLEKMLRLELKESKVSKSFKEVI